MPVARVGLPAERSTPTWPLERGGAEAFRPLHGKELLQIEVGLKHGRLLSKQTLLTSNFSIRKDTAVVS
jgi:hypothetical protein